MNTSETDLSLGSAVFQTVPLGIPLDTHRPEIIPADFGHSFVPEFLDSPIRCKLPPSLSHPARSHTLTNDKPRSHMFFFAHTAGNVPQPILPRRATSVRFRPHPSAKNPRKTTSCHINNSVRSNTPQCQHLLNRFQTRTAIAAVDRPSRTASKVTRP